MKMQTVEKILTHAWFARLGGNANEQDKTICGVIDASLRLLQEIDCFFGTIYYSVIKTVYFQSKYGSMRSKAADLPLHERKVYDYRKRYIDYIRLKLSL